MEQYSCDNQKQNTHKVWCMMNVYSTPLGIEGYEILRGENRHPSPPLQFMKEFLGGEFELFG
jgi:hypothetical protein